VFTIPIKGQPDRLYQVAYVVPWVTQPAEVIAVYTGGHIIMYVCDACMYVFMYVCMYVCMHVV